MSMTVAVRQRFKLSPSDLTFLWEECPRCFYDKAHDLSKRPSAPFPSVFTKIDKANRSFYSGKSTAWISPTLPPGRLDCSETFVQSQDIRVPGYEATCWLSGRTDCLALFTDGSFGLIDFKTTNPGDASTALYVRQLWAYAYCMEHPAKGRPLQAPVTHLGLFCLEPVAMQMLIGEKTCCLLQATPVWKPRRLDEAAFLSFLGRVLEVLSPAEPPASAPACAFCAYRRVAA